MHLQVEHVDAAAMAEAKMENKSMGARIQMFLNFIGAKNTDKLQSYLLPGLIERKLPAMMTDMMSEKMAEKGVIAEAKVLPENKQEKYFLTTIRKIRRAASQLQEEEEEEELWKMKMKYWMNPSMHHPAR